MYKHEDLSSDPSDTKTENGKSWGRGDQRFLGFACWQVVQAETADKPTPGSLRDHFSKSKRIQQQKQNSSWLQV